MGNVWGYARVSTRDQVNDRQIDNIEQFCKKNNLELCAPVFCDKVSAFTDDYSQYAEYNFLRNNRLFAGDILIISEMDRLGRRKTKILEELRFLKEVKKVKVIILEIELTYQLVETAKSPEQELMQGLIINILLELFATFAELEKRKQLSRQRESLDMLKAQGFKFGRPQAIENERFVKTYREVVAGRLQPFAAIRQLGLTKSTYYRYVDNYKAGRL